MRSFPRASNTLTKPAIHTIQRHTQADATKLDRAWLVLRNEACYNQTEGNCPRCSMHLRSLAMIPNCWPEHIR
eukprot:5836364-Pyramimonas_sp.AAC.1